MDFFLFVSFGSGKTTLAKEIFSWLDIPYYELDNVVWIRHNSGDIRRTEQEKEEYLNSILQSDSWIIDSRLLYQYKKRVAGENRYTLSIPKII